LLLQCKCLKFCNDALISQVHFSEHVSVFRSSILLNYLALISGYVQEWFRSMVTDDTLLAALVETIFSKGMSFLFQVWALLMCMCVLERTKGPCNSYDKLYSD
jgi:hypothetical protein